MKLIKYVFMSALSFSCMAEAYPEALAIETERCVLRELTMDDADALFAIASDPQILTYTSLESTAHTSIDQTYSYIENCLKRYKNGLVIPWMIIEKATGHAIGYVQLFDYKSEHRKAEIGYFLLPTHWNKGIGTEITKAIISYAFSYLNVVRLQVASDPRNIGSVRIIEKCGFRYEGLMRSYYIIQGVCCDRSVYSMTDEEFNHMHQDA